MAVGEARLPRTRLALLIGLVLVLAAFNLTFRLGHEFVTEWDESLYAISAWEMVTSRNWIGVTFFGNLDYYNTKPPLNVWLISLAFETFGRGILSLRIVSVTSAWLTVVLLVLWSRRVFGDAVAVLAGAILATTFGFLHVHAGRSANTDALFTLLVLSTVVTLWAGERRPWVLLCLGPLLAATFLLRGLAILMPLTIVAIVLVWRGPRRTLFPLAGAVLLFAIPVLTWSIARYRVDQWQFFERMYKYDFVARSTQVLDQHPGGPLYYGQILLKHQYDWTLAAIVALILFPISRARLRALLIPRWRNAGMQPLVAAWLVGTVLIPTMMLTKLPWYLNTFYPLFAIGVASLLVRAVAAQRAAGGRWRLRVVCAAAIVAFISAEARVWVYSLQYRDLSRSSQGLLLSEAALFAGHNVYRDRLDRSATFVAGLVGVKLRYALNVNDFLRDSQPGDFLLLTGRHHPHHRRALELVTSNNGNQLYRRRQTDIAQRE